MKYEQETKSVFKGAIGALRDGKADREDLNATFVAVCRAAKIPARMVWAMDFCYAEFYLEEIAPEMPGEAEGKSVKGKKSGKDSKEPKGPSPTHVDKEIPTDDRGDIDRDNNGKVPQTDPSTSLMKKKHVIHARCTSQRKAWSHGQSLEYTGCQE